MQNTSPDSKEEPNWQKIKPKYKKDEGGKYGIHRATITVRYQVTLFARCDFRKYPFDQQTLELTVKLLSVVVPGYGKGVRPCCRHPERWRGKDNESEGGHVLLRDSDCLPQFDFARLCSRTYSSAYGAFVARSDQARYLKEKSKGTLYQDQYTLQIIMVRDSASVLWNMCFSLFVIDVMVLSAHGIHMGSLADRMGVNLTLLLTSMAFKWVLSDHLPPVPYLTTMEKYVIMTFFCLWLQGLNFWFLADWYNYRCNKDDSGEAIKTDYWSGDRLVSNNTVTLDITCEFLHRIDRSIMFVEFAALLGKNIWFLIQIIQNQKGRVEAETHYVNLGGLGEYSMKKDMKFVRPTGSREACTYHWEKPQLLKSDTDSKKRPDILKVFPDHNKESK